MSRTMNLYCVKEAICFSFMILGRKIAQYPIFFILISILTFASLLAAVPYIKLNRDIYYILFSDKGKAFLFGKFIDETFPMNSSIHINEIRLTKMPEALVLYLKVKTGGNMLEKNILNEVQTIDEIVKNTTIELNGNTYKYQDICGKLHEKCFENPIIKFISKYNKFLSNKKKLKYPVDIDPLTFSYINTNLNFGGVVINPDGYMEEANALRLVYFVDENDLSKLNIIKKWKIQAYENIKHYNFKNIITLIDPFLFIENYSKLLSDKTKPLISVVIAIVTIFSMITLMTNNWVKSKPWLGIASVMSAGLAVGEAFGFMSLCGVESTDWNISVPILILVTEIDDAYVIIACWRTTSFEDEVVKRMEETYSMAAVSITITSFTNFSTYCVGIMAPFPVIRSFAIYAASCIFFGYFMKIIFFGACLALSGYREKKRIHPFTFQSTEYIEAYNGHNIENKEDFFMKFFRDVIGEAITYPVAKIVIVCLYFLNLTFGIWNFLSLKDGFNVYILYSSDSEMYQSFQVYDQNFRKYPYVIQVVINQTLDYSQTEVQKYVEDFLTRLEDHPNIADRNLTVSWLKYYKTFQKNPVAKYSLQGYNMSKKQDFIDGLQIFFRFQAAEQFKYDIVLSPNRTEILCSRFFLLAENLSTVKVEEDLLTVLWEIAETTKFPVIIHHYLANFVEQGINTRTVTYQLFWVSSILIIIVFVIVIPNIFCAGLIAITVVSTMIEVLGFMSLWNINLDMLSMLILILCLGFCVNYPTHISYLFLATPNKNSNEKIKNSLYYVGFPIIQGSLTTVLGTLILLVIKETYLFMIYVKISLIISLLTTFHALCLIPAILSISKL